MKGEAEPEPCLLKSSSLCVWDLCSLSKCLFDNCCNSCTAASAAGAGTGRALNVLEAPRACLDSLEDLILCRSHAWADEAFLLGAVAAFVAVSLVAMAVVCTFFSVAVSVALSPVLPMGASVLAVVMVMMPMALFAVAMMVVAAMAVCTLFCMVVMVVRMPVLAVMSVAFAFMAPCVLVCILGFGGARSSVVCGECLELFGHLVRIHIQDSSPCDVWDCSGAFRLSSCTRCLIAWYLANWRILHRYRCNHN